MASKIEPDLDTVEGLIVEVEEWYERIRKLRQSLKHWLSGLPSGSSTVIQCNGTE